MSDEIQAEPARQCSVCCAQNNADAITHLNLYVGGSKGVHVCTSCRLVLTDVLRGMMRANSAGLKRGYLQAKGKP